MGKKQSPKVAINYPKWKVRGNPTPNEKLMVCDACGSAAWMPHSPLTRVSQCGCNRRMREATPAEYEAGKAALETVI